MDTIQPYLDYFSQNPGWAITVIFLIAFGEALLIIGLFVPSTAVLIGAGMLVGTGHLDFWPVFLATAIGAILGDQLSYWAGRLFGDRLKTLWPLNRYPVLVAKGEAFVRQHGGKSIALGRFVPGVKAVVPGIVGMFGMGQVYFASINISSGIVWAVAHVFPGILAGQVLSLAGDLSERLLVVLVVLITILFAAGWLIRLGAIALIPWIERLQAKVHAWSLGRSGPAWRRVGRVLAPGNPRAISVILFAAVALTGLLLFAQLVFGITAGTSFANTDISVFRMMQAVRNAPADALMTKITMLGDWPVMLALSIAMMGWLIWRRAWRAAIGLAAVVVIAKLFALTIKLWIQRPRPLELAGMDELFSFPSGHATMSAVCFGVLAVLLGQNLGRWGRALAYTLAALAAIIMAYSRIYLGAHWFSDTLAGLVFGAVMAAAYGVAVETLPVRRIQPMRFAGVALAAFIAAGAVHVATGYDAAAALYAPQHVKVRYSLEQWRGGSWAALPRRRVDLAGKPEELFAAQWAGPLDRIAAALTGSGWTASPPWGWEAGIPYLDPHSKLDALQPRPLLHEGLTAAATFTRPIPGDTARRLVLRVWQTDFEVVDAGPPQGLHLVSVTRDVLRQGFNLYAIPGSEPAAPLEIAAAVASLEQADRVAAIAATGMTSEDRSTLLLASP